ncbi:MAG: hypothetical protein EBR40_05315, partial [Proteobacteria bacterium]|nr:hypothetical protein [Pseudomonadota bacterium]
VFEEFARKVAPTIHLFGNVDITLDPAITAVLKSFGRVGVPLAVYYPPGKGSEPVILPELLTEKIVLDAIGK